MKHLDEWLVVRDASIFLMHIQSQPSMLVAYVILDPKLAVYLLAAAAF